jgi:hypothetical protein
MNQQPERRMVWWLHPAAVFPLVTLPPLLAAYLIPARVYAEQWRTPKYFGDMELGLGLCVVLCFVIGALLARTYPASHNSSSSLKSLRLIRRAFWITIALTGLGYAVWFCTAVARGLTIDLLLSSLSGVKGSTEAMKNEYLQTIKGVTTLTQLAIPAFMFGTMLLLYERSRAVLMALGALTLLTLLRAFANSERLAIVEIVVPVCALLVAHISAQSSRSNLFRFLRVGPLFLVVTFVPLFAGFEYFRSWSNFYQDQRTSFPEFILERISGYYVTALNNGALLLRSVDYPIGTPYNTLSFLFQVPVVKDAAFDIFPKVPLTKPDSEFALFATSANLEFNNDDGLFLPVVDFGLLGGLAFWLCAGVTTGFLFRSFSRFSAAGSLLYPLLYVGILEAARIFYPSSGRVFPAWICLVAVLCLNKLSPSRRQLHLYKGWASL